MPSLASFRRGTRILTERGEVAVEALRIGDTVSAQSGAPRTLRWIGRASYTSSQATADRALLPVRICIGALDNGVPHRDLWVSPDHHLCLDGLRVRAAALVNDASILQEQAVAELSYVYLELDVPDVIHAEGALTWGVLESGHDVFDNATEYRSLYPEGAPEPDTPAAAEPAAEGERLEALRRRLALRAGLSFGTPATSRWRGYLELVQRGRVLGWAQDEEQSRPLRLRILDNGIPLGEVLAEDYREDLRTSGIGDGRHAFCFDIPGGLDPDRRHLIEVRRADDGRPLPGSPGVLEASALLPVTHSDRAPGWRGTLDAVTRERIEGWAWNEETPDIPLSLVILDNGEVITRVLANRYRGDLAEAGIGNGRHAFAVTIPGGLSPLTRHVIQVLGAADGREMPGSPGIIAAASEFDPALERAIGTAVAALNSATERARVLAFLATQADLVLQQAADADAGRETRSMRRQFERRWGRSPDPPGSASLRRALVIDDLTPTPDRDAGSVAILSHMRVLQRLGYEVSFVPAAALSPLPAASAALEALGVRCCRAPFCASVEEVLRRQRDSFELVYLHRAANAAKYLALAREYAPRARVLYSVADLHHVRLARQAKIEGRPELVAHSRRLRQAELNAAAHADAVITHSALEAELLRRAVIGCNVHVVPWSVPVRPTTRPWGERTGVAYIGNFAHTPNVDAARVLAEHIMPEVWRTDSSIQCLLVGSAMPLSIRRLAGPGIKVLGQVPELSSVFEQVRLTVAPLRYGAGVKGKVLESFAAGVPCVMSPIAAEGIPLPEVLGAAIGTDAPSMAAHILRLHAGGDEYEAAVAAGLGLLANSYGEGAVEAALKAAIERRAAPLAGEQTRAGTASMPRRQ